MDQRFLKNMILTSSKGISFIVDQLNLTQHIIEDVIQPKIIIIKNRESAAYWGKLANENIIWMGYDFEYIRTIDKGEIYRITGLINRSERISPEIKCTTLKGSIVLFSQHINQYTKKEKRPTVQTVEQLLELYNK